MYRYIGTTFKEYYIWSLVAIFYIYNDETPRNKYIFILVKKKKYLLNEVLKLQTTYGSGMT